MDGEIATSGGADEPEVAAARPEEELPEIERNGSAEPRLASLTGLLMNKKSQKWNSTSSSSDSIQSKSTTDVDQVPSLARSLRFDDEASTLEPRRRGSFGSLSTHRRAAASSTATNATSKAAGGLTESDLRRFVFQHPRAKRLVSGLRVHAFTRQAFISSFTVGLAIGSVVAIVLKVLKDVTCRMLYS